MKNNNLVENDYPIDFPLKVVGKNVEEFERLVSEVMERHVPGIAPDAYRKRTSRSNAYLAITVTFSARSRAQLEALYQELQRSDLVLMTL